MKRTDVVEGAFASGVPYLRLGAGAPMLAVRLVTSEHENPIGLERRMTLSGLRAFAEHFTVYAANCPPGLPSGATMSDIAGLHRATTGHRPSPSRPAHGSGRGGL